MTINAVGVNGVNPAMLAIPDGGQLTPDAVMMYCATQMRTMDGQVKVMMAKMQTARSFSESLTKLRNLMAQGSQDANDTKRRAEILQAFREAYANAPPEERDALDAVSKHYRSTGCNNDATNVEYCSLAKYDDNAMSLDVNRASDGCNNGVDAKEFEGMDKELGNIADDVNKNSELQMISLQSMMSQRQNIVQMTTNLINKINEPLQAIAQNIK